MDNTANCCYCHEIVYEHTLKDGVCHECQQHTTFAVKNLVCKRCKVICNHISDGLCSKCLQDKRIVQINKKPRIGLTCKKCGMSFFGVNNIVQFCSLVCQADGMAYCGKCNAVLTTNSDIAIQLCKMCGGRKKRTPCSKCNNRVDASGIFKIDGKDLCGECVGKHFNKKIEEEKEKDKIKQAQSTKHRRIIID